MKLFIILTLLLAFILAIQFYIGYRTQKNLVEELQKISSGINMAVDAHYTDVLQQIRKIDTFSVPRIRISLDSAEFVPAIPTIPESLYIDVVEELKNIEKSGLLRNEKQVFSHNKLRDNYIPKWKEELEEAEKILRDSKVEKLQVKLNNEELRSQMEEKISVLEKYLETVAEKDCLSQNLPGEERIIRIENIDVDIDGIPAVSDNTVLWKKGDSSSAERTAVKENFTIRIPDFSLPDKPKVIHYNLQSAEMEKTIQAAIQKNVFLTLALFALSIVAVLLISRKFLQPIGHLKNSFAQVVDGNMDVHIPVNSRDEIGDLTSSFNHMVLELRKNREKEKLLQQKERLASMGQLAAGVAHEIKNPLNAIHLTIDHLKDKYSAKDKTAQKYIRTVQNEINRLDKMVDNFLNFVRSDHLEKKWTDINDLISGVLYLLHKQIESQHITLKTDFSTDFTAEIDPERFKTVLLNIILNAVHAMPDGGELKVTTSTAERTVIIEDTGRGIPPRDLDKIFDLFYTTKSKGTGLGLPTAYKIMKEHGGELTLQSEEGKRTGVVIYLEKQDN